MVGLLCVCVCVCVCVGGGGGWGGGGGLRHAATLHTEVIEYAIMPVRIILLCFIIKKMKHKNNEKTKMVKTPSRMVYT